MIILIDFISEKIFSFYLTGDSSKFTIGGYNLSYADAQNNESISWNYLIDTNYWTVRLSGVKVGSNKIAINSRKAIVDTGTSYLLIPTGN